MKLADLEPSVLEAIACLDGAVVTDHSGRLLTFGAMGNKPMMLNPGELIFKQATVKGFWASKRSGTTSREDLGRMLRELMGYAASGVIDLPIDKAFTLEEAGAAARASAEPGRGGKIAFKS